MLGVVWAMSPGVVKYRRETLPCDRNCEAASLMASSTGMSKSTMFSCTTSSNVACVMRLAAAIVQ